MDAPHEEQKLTPAGLRWPQLWQNTPTTVAALNCVLPWSDGLLGGSTVGQLPVGA